MFSYLLDQLREKVTFLICRAQIQNDALESMASAQRQERMQAIHETPETLLDAEKRPQMKEDEKQSPFQYVRTKVNPNDPSTWGKIARNDLCPCGSGKKFKHCHGKF